MKTTRRNFVVEYKSPRRQATTGSSSIWGNLDLKAIASKVESDIGNAPEDGDSDAIVTAAPDLASLQLAETAECPEPNLPAADFAPMSTNETEARRPSPASFHEEQSATVETSTTGASKMPRTDSIGKRRKENTRAEHTPRSDSIAVELVDDLDALTRENNQLKAFLREKLTRENAQLKALLTRYK